MTEAEDALWAAIEAHSRAILSYEDADRIEDLASAIDEAIDALIVAAQAAGVR